MFIRFVIVSAFILLLPAADEKLVPADFNQRSDSLGMRWDVQQGGQVNDGTNDCFDTGLELQVGGQSFQPQKPQQTADGAELVLSGRSGKIEVTRRIRLDAKRNVLRYAEVLVNTGSSKEQVTVMLHSNLGSNCQQTVWSDGKPYSGATLSKGCVGLAAIQSHNRPTVIWIVGEAKATCPPHIMVQQNRQYQFTWNVTLAPKQTRVLFHYVLQRPGMTAAQVPDTVKALWKTHLVKPELLRPLMSQVVNFRVAGASSGEGQSAGAGEEEELVRIPVIARLMERAGVDDTGTMDVVGVGRSESERMRGKLTGGPLTVTTPQGAVNVTVNDLAGGEGGDPVSILHLRSGESLAATHIAGALALETEAGISLPVDTGRMLWLITPGRREDLKPPTGQLGVLELVDGTRLALADLAATLPLTCVWGRVDFPLARIASITRVIEPTPSWLVTSDDGSTFRAVSEAGELSVTTQRFAKVTVPVGTLVSFQNINAKPAADDESEDGARLTNGDRLAGGLAGPTLLLRAGGKDSAVPVELIAAIERPEEGAGLALVLKDGGRLVGEPVGGAVGFLASGCTFRVPTERVLGWKIKTPPVPEDVEKADEKKDAKKDDAAGKAEEKKSGAAGPPVSNQQAPSLPEQTIEPAGKATP